MKKNNSYVVGLHKQIDQLKEENKRIKEELAAQQNVANIYLNTINFICKQLVE